jgi:hypothetical protein
VNKHDEWWDDWREATAAKKWGGDMTTDVEAMYQAFKARLMQEIAAPKVKDLTESQQQALERFFDSCSRGNAGG